MKQGLLERMANGAILGDGGYVLELEKRGYVQAGPFTPEVCIEHPEAVEQLHLEFIRAGSGVIQALTFYASEDKLATVGLAGKCEEINRAAVRIARKAAQGRDVIVAGGLSTTWVFDADDRSSHERVRALIDRQIELQVEEGVEFFIAETFYHLGEALIALEQLRHTGLPVMATMLAQSVSRDGFTPVECARRLEDAGADIVGLNCLRNPANTLPWMKEIRNAVSCHLGCQPAAYRTPDSEPDFTSLPEFPYAMEGLQLPRAAMAEYAREAQQIGIRYIGCCCGGIASHVREMARALGKDPAQERAWQSDTKPMSAYEYHRQREAFSNPQ
jgi:betaine-homocysteine S-methyltransferase